MSFRIHTSKPTSGTGIISPTCTENDDFNTQLLIIAGICIFFGLIMCLLGYKLFKFILFLTGFFVGFFATYVICSLYMEGKFSGKAKQYQDQIYFAFSFGVGILVGLLTLCLYYLGLFMLGATMGWFAGMAVLPFLKSQAHFLVTNMWLPYCICSGCAILFGVIMLCLQRICIIISTSFLGALMIIHGLDYYIEKGRAMNFTIQILQGNKKAHLPNCWYTWLVLSFIPILTIVGIIVQHVKTSKGCDHRLASGRVLVVDVHQMYELQADDEAATPLLSESA